MADSSIEVHNPVFQMTDDDQAYPPISKPPVYENFDRNVRRATSANYNAFQPPIPSQPTIPRKTHPKSLKWIHALMGLAIIVNFLAIAGIGGALYYLDQKVSPVVGRINGNSSGPAGPPGPQGM